MIKLDSEGKAQDFTFVLSLKNHDHLGQIRNIDPDSVVAKVNMNGANEISFTVYKYNDAEAAKEAEKLGDEEALKEAQDPLWDEITDFKFVYIKEIGEKGEYFEITVEKNDEESLYKTITGTSACEVELSQTYLYGLEINTELDIARADYTSPTVFYDSLKPEASLLHRALYKLPQYSIKYVDASLMGIQRTFSADGTDVYSFFTGEVAEEIGCLFLFDSTDRSISVYDLKTNCVDCGHRGEFSDVCPECGSTSLKYYGEDTTVYVDTENLAESVNLTVDTDSVKNCFKLEAGDDNMTAAIRNLNPNGSDYIYYFSEEQKHDMPDELVEKLESYDALVESYEEEYEQVMADMYEAIDKVIYYTSGMMPTQEDDPTNAKLEAAKLTQASMSPMALTDVTPSTSTATVNTALKSYAKVFVKSGYFKIEINEGEFTYEGTDKDGNGYGYWYGNFKITNYSDEEDVATSETIKITINKDFDTFMDQKIKKYLALEDEEGSIFDVLSIEDLNEFKKALTYYGLNRLTSFYDAVQGCVDIMIEMDQGRENADLYQTMYTPYYNKLLACQQEIDKRQATIDEWGNKIDKAEQRQKAIQKILDFEAYLGAELYKVFCMYKREDKYSNENYISDGLENDEIFENARQFLNVAKEELIKSGEHQRRISAPLSNLLCMPEFESIKDHFKEGNFIRVGIDGEVYRLRLISYQISFGDIQNIDVEFSDVTKTKNGMSDLQSILSKASSMASTYGATVNQVEKSKKQTDFVGDFVAKGFDATAVKIVNNADNQNITMGESGLLARRKDEFYDKYDNTQLKLLSTGIYVTDNAWKSVKTAVGKYYYTDPETEELVEAYGLLAEALVGNLILGNELGIYSSDGSATMSFDNYGLVLNTIDNGSGHYKRILDIQKTDADGNTTSQLYIDTDGNIVLANDQMIQIGETIDNLNAQYANIEKLYVKEATIRNLLAEYATIENLNATNAKIEDLEAENATITGKLEATEAEIGKLEADNAIIYGKLEANEAEIKDLTAENATVTGKLEAAEAEIADLEATKATIGYVDAYKVEVEQLFGKYASLEHLESNYITAKEIDADYAKIDDLKATNANIENLKAKDAEIENLVATKATIEDLNATNATITTLNADLVATKKLVAEKVDADYVDAEIVEANKVLANEIAAKYATIEKLEADYATIKYVDAEIVATEELISKKATIEDLDAAKADIGELNANVANITSIMAGNIGTGLLQTIHLTASNVVIDDAIIKSANISDLDVSKLNAGTVSTDKFIIKSDDGGIQINGSTQQFYDDNGKVRLQIGKDTQGNFNFIVFGEDGTTRIYSHDGITDKAVPDGLIVDKMVSDNAAIQGKKLDIDSVIDRINEDGSKTINSTKIWIDEENQSLGAKFDSITTNVQTAVTQSSTAVTTANEARTTADNASKTATNASTVANQAKETANSADANATEALNTANETKANTIYSVDVMYALGTSTTTAPTSGWDTVAPSWVSGKYMWQKTVTTYGDGSTDESNATCISGAIGQTGSSGKGIKSTEVTYQAGTSGTTAPSGTWSSSVPTVSENQYLWTRTVITYTDDTTSTSYNVGKFGAKGEDGENGSDGRGISSTEITYQVNSSGTTIPTGAWLTSIPTVDAGKYLWTRTVITYTDNTKSTSYAIGRNGTNGAKGDTGVGVSDIVEQYYLSTSNTTQTGGSWKTTQDAWSSGKYIWTRSQITWTDDSVTYTDPVLADAINKANNTANTANSTANTANSNASTALSTANTANQNANTALNTANGANTNATNALNKANENANKITTLTEAVSTKASQTDFEVEQGRINTLIKETETLNTKVTETQGNVSTVTSNLSTLTDKYNQTAQTVEGNKTTIANVTTQVNNLTGDVEGMESRIAEVETTANGIFAQVSSIGGQNLFYYSSKDWLNKTTGQDYIFIGCYKEETDNDMEGKDVTLSIEFKTDNTTSGTFDICYYAVDAPTTDKVVTLFANIPLTKIVNGKYKNTFVYPTTAAITANSDGTMPMFTMIIKASKITGTFGVRKGMLQFGKMATEWQPTSDNVSESLAKVEVQSNKINWLVKSGTDESNFQLTPRTATLVANEINLQGLVTFSGLGSDAQSLIKAPQETIDAWGNGTFAEGVTTIYGGYIQSNSITANEVDVNNLMADSAVVGRIQATELNADMITAGTIRSNLLSLYGLRVYQKDTDIETLSIENTGDITLRGSVESYNYVSGESGWSIKSDGDAEFNDVVVRGSVITSMGGIADIEGEQVQVLNWAGTSYEERESAPFIVYSDGSMVSTRGTFGGVFTGDIKIGNISIIDPSSHAGNDAIVTIQNGDNGIKRVQLSDLDSSSFSQNLLITDNFENTTIQLSQDGYINAAGGYVVDNNSFDSTGIHLNKNEIIGGENSLNILSENLDIGTLGNATSLRVWGDTTLNQNTKFNGDLMLGNSMILSHTDDGFDINFVYNSLTFTVTFESNGGSSVAPKRDVAALSTITAPSNPTRNGYTFAGWYKDSLLNVKFDFNTDVISDNTTLYAKWNVVPAKAPAYEVSYPEWNEGRWTTPYVINATSPDGGTLSYHWEVNYYEGSAQLLALEDVFANKVSNNITVDELNEYAGWSYGLLSGTCTITNTKLGTTASTEVFVSINGQ